MARDAPDGDKTQMNKSGKKIAKKKDKPSKESANDCLNDVNLEMSYEYDPEFDEAGNFELLQKHFNQKLLLMRTEFQGKIDAFRDVIKDKDVVIGQLQTEVAELKKEYNYISKDIDELKDRACQNESSIDTAVKNHNALVDKASDLEDRSRRNNVVFYNIPEEDTGEPEDCLSKIIDLVKDVGFFESDYTLELDRAHRLGRKPQASEDGTRPRPIIARFCFYQDKLKVMSNGKLFKHTGFAARDDYSKLTLNMHKELIEHVKKAQMALEGDKNQIHAISFFKTTYRRLTLTYRSKTNPQLPSFTRNFSLDYINSNNKWFVPAKRNTYNNVQKAGN